MKAKVIKDRASMERIAEANREQDAYRIHVTIFLPREATILDMMMALYWPKSYTNLSVVEGEAYIGITVEVSVKPDCLHKFIDTLIAAGGGFVIGEDF